MGVVGKEESEEMSGERGRCNSCGKTFSLAELRTGRCPWGCGSDDLSVEDSDGKEKVRVAKHYNSNGDRTKHHERV